MAPTSEGGKCRGAPSRSPGEAASLKVLVVDDRMAMVKTVSRMLGSLGYNTVDQACGVLTALHNLRKSRYDLVLAELRTAHMDGISLSAWLKGKWDGTLVIIMTDLDATAVETYRYAGVVDRWLFKPFGTGELATLLEGVLDGQPA